MKRTKELFYRPHPDAREREGISGVTFMDGEDQGTSILVKTHLIAHRF